MSNASDANGNGSPEGTREGAGVKRAREDRENATAVNQNSSLSSAARADAGRGSSVDMKILINEELVNRRGLGREMVMNEHAMQLALAEQLQEIGDAITDENSSSDVVAHLIAEASRVTDAHLQQNADGPDVVPTRQDGNVSDEDEEDYRYEDITVFNRPRSEATSIVNRLHELDARGPRLPPHQIEALEKLKAHVECQRPTKALVQMPMGTGKTAVAVLAPYVIEAARVLVLTPSRIITEQMVEAFNSPDNGILARCGFMPVFRREANRNAYARDWLPGTGIVEAGAQALENALITWPLVVVNVQRIQDHVDFQPKSLRNAHFDLVVVAEAHHILADTWRQILQWFDPTETTILYLTATPHRPNGESIIDPKVVAPIYTLTRSEAVARDIIRDLQLVEIGDLEDDHDARFSLIARQVTLELRRQDFPPSHVNGPRCNHFHQSMVIVENVAAANRFVGIYNNTVAEMQGELGGADPRWRAEAYYMGVQQNVLNNFCKGSPGANPTQSFRTLVIVGTLLDGFDHSNVSVVGIACQIPSMVLFTQFVCGAVRRNRLRGDATDATREAVIVSHIRYGQRKNFYALDTVLVDEGQIAAEDRI